MSNTLICSIDLFSLNQRVYLNDTLLKEIPTDNLSLGIASLYNKDIDSIHLFGEEEFLEKYIEDIKFTLMVNYGINNVKIEVN